MVPRQLSWEQLRVGDISPTLPTLQRELTGPPPRVSDSAGGGALAGASTPSPRSSRSKGWRRTLLVAFSIALFAVILWFGGVESWNALLSGDPRLYFAAFLLTGVAPMLSAWRLRALTRAVTDRDVGSWRRFFHVNMTAVSLGLVLPRNAALLGGKAVYLRTMGVPILRGTWAVLMENFADVFFLAAIVLPGVLVLVGGVGPGLFLAGTLAGIAVMLALTSWTRGRDWRGLLGAWARRIPWVSSRLPVAAADLVPGPVRAVPMLGATVLIHMVLALRAYAIGLALGLDASWLVFAAAYPLTQLGLALAVAPGALGTLDASWLGLLLLGGLSNADALSFTVALRACIVVFLIAWYGVSVLLSLSLPPVGAPDAMPQPATGTDEPRWTGASSPLKHDEGETK